MKTPPTPRATDSKFQVPAAWRWHERILRRLRSRLLGQTQEHLAAAENLQKADDPDFASLASEESEFEALIAEVKSEADLLAEVEAALERLRRGTYGICEASHEAIPAARLRALPWTRFRREVAAQRER